MGDVSLDDPIFSRPLRIARVSVEGNSRTRRYVIEQELAQAKKARTVREVSTGIMQALRALKQVDAFEGVEIFCDVSKRKAAGNSDMQFTDVVVRVREKRMLNLKAETFVTSTGSEGGVETMATLNNSLGYTEKLNAAISYGTASATAGRVEAIKPKVWGLPLMGSITASTNTATRALYSSYDEKTKELRCTLRHHGGGHEFSVGSAWRDVLPVRNPKNEFEYAASGLIIAQAKPSLKNSVSYTYTRDRRDDAFGPTQGSLFKLNSEFAGFGGDAQFWKSTVSLQQFAPVLEKALPGSSMGASFNMGFLCPLRARTDKEPAVGTSSSICDRFWLGGPMNLRGFDHKGCGPRTSPNKVGAKGGDSLGGDVFWSIGASLCLPFPHSLLHQAGMRTHVYANAGNLCAWETSVQTLLYGARASVGVGILFPTQVGRIEANLSHVIRANSRDQVRRFQLGLGLEFL